MTRAKRYAAVMAVAFTLLCAIPAMAAQEAVDERTQLTFSEPVMVPGKTLSPGTYTFQIIDSDLMQQLVQILDQQGKVVATTITVPLKRNGTEVKGDTVLRFNPTTAGGDAAVALKGWFYPGKVYGHEFVYPDEEARHIAQRTKSVVLSTDVSGKDANMARIYTYDAAGRRAPWNSAELKTAPGAAPSAATAPMMQSARQGMRVTLDDLEENTKRYIGKTVSVDAEVDEVFGPRVFKIDEPNWGDLDPEVLVYVPTDLAALVKEGDRVTVTGAVRPFVRAEIERDFDWLDPMPDLDASFAKRPVLVASRIVGGDNNVAMMITVGKAAYNDTPVGTSGTAAATGSAISDVNTLASGGDHLVGRHVNMERVGVTGPAGRNGFWVRAADGTSIYVLPAQAIVGARPAKGDTVSIKGVVLEMPRSMRDQFKSMANVNDDVYVFASSVTR